jgi:peptidoglycan/LPS O-acetylase OafA/YrhL
VPDLQVQSGSSSPRDYPATPKSLLRRRMPELDTLRGVAILGVVFLHGIYSSTNALHFAGYAKRLIQLTQPGWLGVNLFLFCRAF